LALLVALAALSAPAAPAYNERPPPNDPGPAYTIAFADRQGRIGIARTDARGAVRIISPPEGRFAWPTWAPGGNRIAYSGRGTAQGGEDWALFLTGLGEGTPTLLHRNAPGAGPILPGLPRYLLWSPRGERAAIIANGGDGLELLVRTLGDGRSRRLVATQPLYASWSQSGRALLVHGGGGHLLYDAREGGEPTALPVRSGAYRAPAWRPGHRTAALIRSLGAERHALVLKRLSDEAVEPLVTSVLPQTAFLWAPDGEQIAVAEPKVPGSPVFRRLAVHSPDGAPPTPVTLETDFFAFLWSPDGDRIALVAPIPASERVRWRVLDIDAGATLDLTSFRPSPEQATLFRCFDQFAASHSTWSPDGPALVFAGTVAEGLGDGQLTPAQPSGVYTTSTTLGAKPTRVADGVIGSWSPRCSTE
jgi:hypothetical protein